MESELRCPTQDFAPFCPDGTYVDESDCSCGTCVKDKNCQKAAGFVWNWGICDCESLVEHWCDYIEVCAAGKEWDETLCKCVEEVRPTCDTAQTCENGFFWNTLECECS